MRCPRCDHELSGTPAKCSDCKGCWVTRADIPKLANTTEPAGTVTGPSKINCPECYAAMEAIVLNEVHLDRCMQHGVWFDIGEITDVLRKNGKLGPGEVAREDKPSTGSKVAEGAAGVGAGILEVVGAVFDIVS